VKEDSTDSANTAINASQLLWSGNQPLLEQRFLEFSFLEQCILEFGLMEQRFLEFGLMEQRLLG